MRQWQHSFHRSGKCFHHVRCERPVHDPNAAGDAADAFIAADKAKTAPPLAAGQWINSEPLPSESLKGKVVLVEFWTFGCSNCINTLPAIKSFDAKYREKGLTVMGIETPELSSEKSFDGLQKAVKDRGIEYPVLTDYKSANWDAFKVEAWPTIFILDQQGRIRYKHVGEGAYDAEEKVIAALLAGDNGNDEVFDGHVITKGDAEWQAQLTPTEYKVLREAATDPPFHSDYHDNHEPGNLLLQGLSLEAFYVRHKVRVRHRLAEFLQAVQ